MKDETVPEKVVFKCESGEIVNCGDGNYRTIGAGHALCVALAKELEVALASGKDFADACQAMAFAEQARKDAILDHEPDIDENGKFFWRRKS